MTTMTERQGGSLRLPEMAGITPSTPQALLQCDLATCPWRRGFVSFLLNLGHLLTALANRVQQK